MSYPFQPSENMLRVRATLSDEQKVLFDFSYQFDGFQALMFVGYAVGGAAEGVTNFWERFKHLVWGETSH